VAPLAVRMGVRFAGGGLASTSYLFAVRWFDAWLQRAPGRGEPWPPARPWRPWLAQPRAYFGQALNLTPSALRARKVMTKVRF
jgi:hypothetical protein